MNRLDDEPALAIEVPAPQDATDLAPILPHPLRQYLGGDVDAISWRRLGLGASQYVIPLADGSAMARMLRIPAGKPVPEHSHNGLELTLVLCGAFADGTGVYGPGDLQEADQSLDHQPHAADGEDCICLAITDAPLRFKSMAARMVQPLLGIWTSQFAHEAMGEDDLILTTFKVSSQINSRSPNCKYLTELYHDNPAWINLAEATLLSDLANRPGEARGALFSP